jgi:hypothetical protein
MISMYKIKSVLKLHGAGCEQRKLQGRMTEDDNLFGIGNDFPLNLKPHLDTEFITSFFTMILREITSQLSLARNSPIGLASICWLTVAAFRRETQLSTSARAHFPPC